MKTCFNLYVSNTDNETSITIHHFKCIELLCWETSVLSPHTYFHLQQCSDQYVCNMICEHFTAHSLWKTERVYYCTQTTYSRWFCNIYLLCFVLQYMEYCADKIQYSISVFSFLTNYVSWSWARGQSFKFFWDYLQVPSFRLSFRRFTLAGTSPHHSGVHRPRTKDRLIPAPVLFFSCGGS